ASCAARLTRVFLATVYVAPAPRDFRSSVTCGTESPRYSVTTAVVEFWKCSLISATAWTLAGFAMFRLLSASSRPGEARTPRAQKARGVEEWTSDPRVRRHVRR